MCAFPLGIEYDFDGSISSVAVNNKGQVVEFHRDKNLNIFYYSAQFQQGYVPWGTKNQLSDAGQTPSVALNDRGLVIEIHQTYDTVLECNVGQINFDNSIDWCCNGEIEKGYWPSVALANDNYCVVVFRSAVSYDLYYRIGLVNTDTKKIDWGNSIKYGTGDQPKIAMNNRGVLVEVHKSEHFNTLWYYVGIINEENKTIDWGGFNNYCYGQEPSVAITNKGFVTEVHRTQYGTTLWQITGTVDKDQKIINWDPFPSESFDYGELPSVAVARNGSVAIQTHTSQWSPTLWYSTLTNYQPSTAVSGSVTLPYLVLAVIYAPPGSGDGSNPSSVVYSQSSTMGSTISMSTSFKNDTSITTKVGSLFASSFDFSATTTSNTTLDVKKSKTTSITVIGAQNADGIDHDQDRYVLCLNPVMSVIFDDGDSESITWGYASDGSTRLIENVLGVWLKNPTTLMPPGVKSILDSAGLTNDDYQMILSTNPFSGGGTDIDLNRYLPTENTISYNPPSSPGGSIQFSDITMENVSSQTLSETKEVTYEVGFSVSSEAGFGDLFNLSLEVNNKFTWTNNSTLGTSTLSSQSATATIGGPAYGYTGSNVVQVYWDTVFNTFMFAFI